MTPIEYFEQYGVAHRVYQQNQEYFLSLNTTDCTSGYLHRLILLQYPTAYLVKYHASEVVYNLGTVFDLIQNPGISDTEFLFGLGSSLAPDLLANQIVSAQPTRSPESNRSQDQCMPPLNVQLAQDLDHMDARHCWYQQDQKYFILISRTWHLARLLYIVQLYYPHAYVEPPEHDQPSDQMKVCIGTVFDLIKAQDSQ